MAIKKLKAAPEPLTLPDGLNGLPLPVLVFRASTGEIIVNSTFESIFGKCPEGRFAGKPLLGLVHERPVRTPLFSLPGRHAGYQMDSVGGDTLPVELRVSENSSKPGDFLVLIEEVREKQELESQLIQNHIELKKAFEEVKRTQNALIQNAKLASLGELSSGIAHELNQPLQAIMGFSQELAESEKLSPQGSEFMGDIVHASRKMAEIIKSLRSFAREAGDELTPVSVGHAVEEAIRLMSHSLMQKGVTIDFSSEREIPLISANAIQLEQVFVNLMSNARDAIESSGRKNGKITIRIFKDSTDVKATVADDGCGMPEETRQRIFDPFFTTKEVGKGTGLGLSISYGILKRFGAGIAVQSQPGTGTRFEISFRPEGKTKEGEAA